MYVRVMSLDTCCSSVRRACGRLSTPVSVGSIFNRIAPKKRCKREESCAETAWPSKPLPASTKLDEPLAAEPASDPAWLEVGSRPTASKAMISDEESGGSEA